MGYYFVPIFIGPDHHRVDLIMDTGSALTTFPCSGCNFSCGHHFNKPFQKDASKSYSPINCSNEYYGWKCGSCFSGRSASCHYVLNYVEGSGYEGDYGEDYVVFQDEIANFDKETNEEEKKKYKSLFGCTSRESGMLKDQDADGILGLGILTNCKWFFC